MRKLMQPDLLKLLGPFDVVYANGNIFRKLKQTITIILPPKPTCNVLLLYHGLPPTRLSYRLGT